MYPPLTPHNHVTPPPARTERLRDQAGNIKRGGAAGVYQREFDQMQGYLDGVRQMLGNATVSDEQVELLQNAIDELR